MPLQTEKNGRALRFAALLLLLILMVGIVSVHIGVLIKSVPGQESAGSLYRRRAGAHEPDGFVIHPQQVFHGKTDLKRILHMDIHQPAQLPHSQHFPITASEVFL